MILIVVILAIISFFLALNSLRGVINHKEIEHAKKQLSRGRVIFQDSSTSGSGSSSDSSSS